MSRFDALREQAGQRSRGYWLLSRLFLEVPTAPRLADLGLMLTGEGRYAVADGVAELLQAVGLAQAQPEFAAAAFTRHLVIGDKENREPLPYEAHVREGRLPGESTAQVRAAMLAAGYTEVAPEAPSPDHLGAELRFMALLCHDEHRAWCEGDAATAAASLERQRAFLADHLALWGPDYCRGLAARTDDAYLRAIANLAAASIADDVAVVGDICDWVAPQELAASVGQRQEFTTIE